MSSDVKPGDLAAALLERETPKRVECSWCGLVMSRGAEPVSHGICPPCAQDHFGLDLLAAH